MENDYTEYTCSGYISSCCGSPIYGEVTDGIGICSRCKEWSDAEKEGEE